MTERANRRGAALDTAYLDAQTFGDADLARDLLKLFVEQSRRLVAILPELGAEQQTATAHLLRGSCQAIGATGAAELLARYEDADAAARASLAAELSLVCARVQDAIKVYLAGD